MCGRDSSAASGSCNLPCADERRNIPLRRVARKSHEMDGVELTTPFLRHKLRPHLTAGCRNTRRKHVLIQPVDTSSSSGSHEAFITPLWKQGVGSTIRCVATEVTR